MKLSVTDRLIAMSLLPKEANFLTLKLVRKALDALGFSEDEHKVLKFERAETGGTKWNADADPMKDVALGEVAKNELVKALKKLDETGKLTSEHVGLYELLVEQKAE